MTPHPHKDKIIAWAKGFNVHVIRDDGITISAHNPDWDRSTRYGITPPFSRVRTVGGGYHIEYANCAEDLTRKTVNWVGNIVENYKIEERAGGHYIIAWAEGEVIEYRSNRTWTVVPENHVWDVDGSKKYMYRTAKAQNRPIWSVYARNRRDDNYSFVSDFDREKDAVNWVSSLAGGSYRIESRIVSDKPEPPPEPVDVSFLTKLDTSTPGVFVFRVGEGAPKSNVSECYKSIQSAVKRVSPQSEVVFCSSSIFPESES